MGGKCIKKEEKNTKGKARTENGSNFENGARSLFVQLQQLGTTESTVFLSTLHETPLSTMRYSRGKCVHDNNGNEMTENSKIGIAAKDRRAF